MLAFAARCMHVFLSCSLALIIFRLCEAAEAEPTTYNSLWTMFFKAPITENEQCQEALGSSLLQMAHGNLGQKVIQSRGWHVEQQEIEGIGNAPGRDDLRSAMVLSSVSLGHLSNSSNINSSSVYFSTQHPYTRTQRDLPQFTANVNLTWEGQRIELHIAGSPVTGAFQESNTSSCDPFFFEWTAGLAYSKWVDQASGDVPYYGSSQERMYSIGDEVVSVHPDVTPTSLSVSELSSLRYMWQQLSSKPTARTVSYTYSQPFGVAELSLQLTRPTNAAPPGGWPVILHIPGGQWGYQQFVNPDVPAVLEEFFNVSQSFAIAAISLRQINRQHVYPYPEAVRHPAELEDAIAAFQFLVANAADLHINSDRIVVHGVSSGALVAAILPVALAREPELANGSKLLGAMVIEGPSDLLSLQPDHFQGRFEVSCDTAASQLIGCGTRMNDVSIQNLTDVLRGVDQLLTSASVPHRLGSGCSANRTVLAQLRENDAYQELATSMALARDPAMHKLVMKQSFANLTAAADVIASLDKEHGTLHMTVALMKALAASPVVQVAGAHAEGRHLPPYFLYHAKADSEVPSKQSWRLVAALQESGTDFTMFMPQFGSHTTYATKPLWDDFMYGRNISVEDWQGVLIHHDVMKLLPTWLADISFFDIA